jgi:hypothetical protein
MTSQTVTPAHVGMSPAHGLLRDHKAAQVLIALVVTVTAVLISIAVSRDMAPASGGHRSGSPIVVPNPVPGPFGS